LYLRALPFFSLIVPELAGQKRIDTATETALI
jgi:hypothetical protein